jgi:hypothetical protein
MDPGNPNEIPSQPERFSLALPIRIQRHPTLKINKTLIVVLQFKTIATMMQKSIVAFQAPVALFGKAKSAKKPAGTVKKAAPLRKSSSSGECTTLSIIMMRLQFLHESATPIAALRPVRNLA